VTKPTTNILSTSGTLENFMRELVVSPVRVPKPVPEIILMSHASETGWLEIELTDKPDAPPPDEPLVGQYQELATAGTKLNVPEEVLKDKGGTVHPAIVRIRGCRIGIAEKFLQQFKDALKNVSTIVAPKHYQAASTWTDEAKNLVGRMEFLLYCFESYPGLPVDTSDKALRATTPRQKIINTFKADLHVRVDGSPVPSDQWDKWFKTAGVPGKVKVAEKYHRNPMVVRMPSDWQVNPNEGDLKGVLAFEHVIMTNNGPWKIGGEDLANGTAEARRNFVKKQLRDPATKDKEPFAMCFEDHPWPIWERYLKVRYETFTSFDDFMAGFDWLYEADGWRGMRHVYRMLVPITLPVAQNILMANYYPVAATGAYIGLDETNGVYFAAL
jgi:hypothetical protein